MTNYFKMLPSQKFLLITRRLSILLTLVSQTLAASFILLYSLQCFSTPQGVFPANIRRALDLEIRYNPGLDQASLIRMAAAVLIRTDQQSQEQALDRVQNLTTSSLRTLAQREFPIQYIEVPVNVINEVGSFVERENIVTGNPHMRSFRYSDQGVEMLRYFIHPLAGVSKVEEALEKNGHAVLRKTGRFMARMTSSRSVYIVDQERHEHFSLKLSLPQAMGSFADKVYLARQAEFHLTMSELIEINNQTRPQEAIRLQKELGYVGFVSQTGSEAQLIRSLDGFKSGVIELTASAIFGGNLAKKIAAANGAFDVYDYWTRNFLEPLAVLSGRMAGNIGVWHNSFHSQNIIVRLNSNMQVVEVGLRDPDFYIEPSAFDMPAFAGGRLRRTSIPESNIRSKIGIEFALLNGIPKFPSWLSQIEYKRWIERFAEVSANSYQKAKGDLPISRRATTQAVKEILNNDWLMSRNYPPSHLIRPNGHYFLSIDALKNPDSKTGTQSEIADHRQAMTKSFMEFYIERYPWLAVYKRDPAAAVIQLLQLTDVSEIKNIANRQESEPLRIGLEILAQEYFMSKEKGLRASRLHSVIDRGALREKQGLLALNPYFAVQYDDIIAEVFGSLSSKEVTEYEYYTTLFYEGKFKGMTKTLRAYLSRQHKPHALKYFFDRPEQTNWFESPLLTRVLLEKIPLSLVKHLLVEINKGHVDFFIPNNFLHVQKIAQQIIQKSENPEKYRIPTRKVTPEKSNYQLSCEVVFHH